MGDLMRRRAMMAAASSPIPIECPYITDGLIFWLDGLNRGGVNGRWTDLIGGKTFSLFGVTELTNGVTFSSSGYGTYSGAVSDNWQNETIEIAVASMALKNKCFLSPANATTIGIGLISATSANQFNVNADGSSYKKWNGTANIARLSANDSYCVIDGSQQYQNASVDSWGENQTTTTYLGCRYVSSRSRYMNGTMYSLRIYNRKLSVAEMKANQAVDIQRFYS